MTPSLTGFTRRARSAETLTGMIGNARIKTMYETYEQMDDDDYPTEIIIPDNNLGHKEITKLIETIRPKVTKLNFKGNSIARSGIIKFTETISEIISKIKYINFERCKIGDKGGAILINDGLTCLANLT